MPLIECDLHDGRRRVFATVAQNVWGKFFFALNKKSTWFCENCLTFTRLNFPKAFLEHYVRSMQCGLDKLTNFSVVFIVSEIDSGSLVLAWAAKRQCWWSSPSRWRTLLISFCSYRLRRVYHYTSYLFSENLPCMSISKPLYCTFHRAFPIHRPVSFVKSIFIDQLIS